MANKNSIVLPLNFTARTAGNGLWSHKQRTLLHKRAEVRVNTFQSELRVYFDTLDWDVKHDGLIYTDGSSRKTGWINDLRAALVGKGFSGKAAMAASYSEQGMQGKDFVSLDVDDTFVDEARALVQSAAQGGTI